MHLLRTQCLTPLLIANKLSSEPMRIRYVNSKLLDPIVSTTKKRRFGTP